MRVKGLGEQDLRFKDVLGCAAPAPSRVGDDGAYGRLEG